MIGLGVGVDHSKGTHAVNFDKTSEVWHHMCIDDGCRERRANAVAIVLPTTLTTNASPSAEGPRYTSLGGADESVL